MTRKEQQREVERRKKLKDQIRESGATADAADEEYEENPTAFERLRRQHIMQYSYRIFADSGVSDCKLDSAFWKPQYIGREEEKSSYPIFGFRVPRDKNDEAYIESRRASDDTWSSLTKSAEFAAYPDSDQGPSTSSSSTQMPRANARPWLVPKQPATGWIRQSAKGKSKAHR